MDTMEEALLADGVAPGQLYPYDVDRAFDSLARIRPHIDTWWSGAAIQTRLLTSGRIDLCAVSSIRAQNAIESGAPVRIAWQGNIRSVEGWVILKGTPKQGLCRRFVAFAADAERQAVFARHINSSPTLPGRRHTSTLRAQR
jgi:putative spermidine/putrescine transport system substrate-binding protein